VRARRVGDLAITVPAFERRYGLIAEALLFQTNDPGMLAAADASFGRFPLPADDRAPLVVGLYVEDRPGHPIDRVPEGGSRPAAAEPGASRPGRVVNRTYGASYLISGEGHDLAVADVEAGVAVGYISTTTAADVATVRYSFLESMALSLLPRGRGYVVLHAAGVVRDGLGIVIQGPAGAGKSTLTMACARRGFGVFAEDAIFARAGSSGLELWGLPWTLRLLPDARTHFPELAGLPDRLQPNGETKIEVELDAVRPGSAIPCARPGPVVFVERGTGGPTRIEALPATAPASIEVHWPWDSGWTAGHDRIVERLADQGVYRLHMNGTPDEAVNQIERLLDER